jgi:dipeptidyl aminopeptidase/acylaminoacyl peptidase
MNTKLLVLLCLVIHFSVLAQDKERLSLDHYADYESTSEPQLSPDGSQILYSRSWINLVDDKRETDLWIVKSDGSLNRFFLNGSNGRWSPDGTKIAFTRQGEPDGTQLFVKYLGEEGEPTQITKLGENPGSMEWSPDGQFIAFTMHTDIDPALKMTGMPSKPEGAKWTAPPRVIDQVDYSQDRVGFLERGYRQLFVVPAEGGTARQLTKGNWNVNNGVAWAKDGQHIYFSSYREEDAEYARGQSNIYAVSIAERKISEITTREGTESSIAVSPDGNKIAFVGSLWTKNFYQDQKLFVMNTDGTALTCISENLDERPGSPTWAPDGTGVYYNIQALGKSNLYFSDLKGKHKAMTEGNHMLSVNDIAQNGMAVATWSDPHNPPDIVAFNLKTPQIIKRVTHVNSDVLDYLDLGEVEELWYKSTDGTDIQGWIVKPPNFDASKKYPLVLRIHGGPHGMYNVAFNYNFQLHAAQDQVVLYTNPRGSTGYGYNFANAIQNAYPGNDYNDLMAGVDVLLEKGYIDENKMYVYGGSGGGVLTSWIVGQTDRFAAASVNYPVTNWFSFVGTTDGPGWYYNFEKYPWEDPSEHIKRSPLMYVNNVKTPTMLMCGENDLRTPISQTEEYYQALKMNKVPTVMIRFNDEFHGTSSKPSNFLRTFAYLNAWFEKHPERKMIRP